MNKNISDFRIAIIGCGAVFEQFYLPAIKKLKLNIVSCVDLDLSRASFFSNKLKANSSNDYRSELNEFDAAIVLLPHFLHAPIAIDLLNKGKHILVEKPMALDTSECYAMISAAKRNNKILAVGNFRRNYNNTIWLKEQLINNNFGSVKNFIFKDGGTYSWPVTTDSFWDIKKAGGGVLIDTGSHTIDQLVYFLGGADVLGYKDDSYGGPEAECLLSLKLKNGSKGIMEFSRTRNIGASGWIETEKNEIFIELTGTKCLIAPKNDILGNASRVNFKKQSYVSLFQDQLFNWCTSIVNDRQNYVSGEEALKSISIIEKCYELREKWTLPWIKYETKID